MKYNQRSKIEPDSLFLLFAVLLIVVPFILQTRTAEAQSNQQPVIPPYQQPTPPQQGKVAAPFPQIEGAQIVEFDALPKEAQKARLEDKGPLFPEKYSMSNFSMRAFVKGDWPLAIDYALQPNSSALLTISAEGVEPYSVLLTEPATTESEGMKGRLRNILRLGSTSEQTAAALLQIMVEEFLRHPERSRRHTVVHLPASFGERPQVGKLSIQAFTNGPGEITPAHFSLYGLGMGDKALGSTASIDRDSRAMSNHFNSYGLAAGQDRTRSIDPTILPPLRINIDRRQKVRYRVYSRSAFFKLAALFYRVVRGNHESYTEQVYWEELGSITERGSISTPRPGRRGCKCEWDGMYEGTASRGSHVLEVRAWEINNEDDWAWARSSMGVQVN